MPTASFLPASSRARRKPSIRRVAAWLAAVASDPRESTALVIGFAAAHAVLWTIILINLKEGQDIHSDVAEAYTWGQKLLWGYGKHPPLAGWVAGLWFRLFPVVDWSTYALAMATVGCAMVICWFIALRVVDRRRAFLTVVMLAIYPIFNFKGFKYNPDLLQLVTLPLVVLAYQQAFEKRNLRSGLWLGLACALALLTKYWALTMIGAVGIAALLHPDRLLFLRSPAPWVAIVTFAIAILPHLWWLKEANYASLSYADIYAISNRAKSLQLVLTYIAHNIALLMLPVSLAAAALTWRHRWRAPMPRAWSHGENRSVNLSQAFHIWIIQIVVAIGPPLGGLIFTIYMKTDWAIPLFFLTPLALVAIPQLRMQKVALFRIVVAWLVFTLGALAASAYIPVLEISKFPGLAPNYIARAELARELTRAWHTRFLSNWAVVAGGTDIAEPTSFYSPDHPAPLTPGNSWSGLMSLEEAKRLGFIGVCDQNDPSVPACEAWMAANADHAEHITMTTRRFLQGHPGPPNVWQVYIVPPAS